MKLLIVFASRYGCTEKAAEKLAAHAGSETKMINLSEDKAPQITWDDYNAVAVGGSIYAGNIQQEVKDFCSENIERLLEKKLGLFICCGFTDRADEQLENSFPERLLEHARVKGYFGYEFNFERMNFLARLAVKKLAKVKESKSEIKDENIKEFSESLIAGGNF